MSDNVQPEAHWAQNACPECHSIYWWPPDQQPPTKCTNCEAVFPVAPEPKPDAKKVHASPTDAKA